VSAAAAGVLLAAAALAGAPAAAVPLPPARDRDPLPAAVAELPDRMLLGRSRSGRPIVAVRQGAAEATRVLLVLGQMHGSEPQAPRVVAALRRSEPPAGVQLWTVATMNPDGRAVGSRYNAAGVDLNRNFPNHWSPRLHYPGPAPGSEPETRAMLRFLTFLQPDAVLSYHQPFGIIDVTGDKTAAWAKRLARWTGLQRGVASCVTVCGGTLAGWINARLPGWAITIELPASVTDDLVQRNVDAIWRLSTRIDDVSLPAPA
jgi:murein peptide amidase A